MGMRRTHTPGWCWNCGRYDDGTHECQGRNDTFQLKVDAAVELMDDQEQPAGRWE
jgi:hypothetical protein